MTAPITDEPIVEPISTGRDTTPIRNSAASVLSWGFRISVVVLAIGLAIAAFGDQTLAVKATSLEDLIPDLLDGKASAIVSLAILAMMITPVVAVLVVARGFHKIGDRRYARISFVVLLVLAASIASSLLR
jgi:uncharacterized membrane protein